MRRGVIASGNEDGPGEKVTDQANVHKRKRVLDL